MSDLIDETPSPKPRIITLDVGGRKFRTFVSTLKESPKLKAQFSGYWPADLQEDGSYFLDSDPDLFEHLLRHMRYPNSFPLFWSKQTGFDYSLYARLEVEADYYRLVDLYNWIRKQTYLKAIHTVCEPSTFMQALGPEGIESREYHKGDGNTYYAADTTLDHFTIRQSDEYFNCPRNIPFHKVLRGDPLKCGRACKLRENFDEDSYSRGEEYFAVYTIPKTIKFDNTVCTKN